MFNQYADLILLIMVIIELLTILLVIMLLRKINNLERINKSLKSREETFATENSKWRTTIPRSIRLGIVNAENIENLKKQQDYLNHYMGTVLGVSKLMPSKELGIEVVDIVEYLREQVKWYEEVTSQNVDENEYYKGD